MLITFDGGSPPPSQVLHGAGDVEMSLEIVANSGAYVLRSFESPAREGECVRSLPLDSPGVYAFDGKTGEWLLFDSRLKLTDSETCSTAPRTIFNGHTCAVKPECSPLQYDEDTEVELNEANIRKFYTVGGMRVHYITGLRLEEEQNTQQYSTVGVCDSKTSTRWRREAGGCESGTVVGSGDLDSSTNTLLGTELQAAGAALNDSGASVIDLPSLRSNSACSLASKGISVTAVGACFTQVHPDENTILSFDAWAGGGAHEGNVAALSATPPRANPIKAFADSGASASLAYPSWHDMGKWRTNRVKKHFPYKVGVMGETVKVKSEERREKRAKSEERSARGETTN